MYSYYNEAGEPLMSGEDMRREQQADTDYYASGEYELDMQDLRDMYDEEDDYPEESYGEPEIIRCEADIRDEWSQKLGTTVCHGRVIDGHCLNSRAHV